MITVKEYTIFPDKITHVTNLFGDPLYRRYKVYFIGGSSIEIYENRSDMYLSIPREEFIKLLKEANKIDRYIKDLQQEIQSKEEWIESLTEDVVCLTEENESLKCCGNCGVDMIKNTGRLFECFGCIRFYDNKSNNIEKLKDLWQKKDN